MLDRAVVMHAKNGCVVKQSCKRTWVGFDGLDWTLESTVGLYGNHKLNMKGILNRFRLIPQWRSTKLGSSGGIPQYRQ